MNYEHFGPPDLQIPWHRFFGQYFENKSILDIGSGRGNSKTRLEINGNYVLTHDVNRALMNQVDIVCMTSRLMGVWDIVTAFDVIEHVCYNAENFVQELFSLSCEAVLISTPNKNECDKDWHYFPEEFMDIIDRAASFTNKFYFQRFKHHDVDEVREVSRKEFITNSSYALGILGYV